MSLTFKLSLLLIISSIYATIQAQSVHHDIVASINIKDRSVNIIDDVTIPASILKNKNDSLVFSINAAFAVKLNNPGNGRELTEIRSLKIDTSSVVKVKKYFAGKPGKNNDIKLSLEYSGMIRGTITSNPVDYARGFSETTGIISDDGIYLAGSTKWIPDFDTPLFTFNLTVVIDSSWGVISQGTRTNMKINGSMKAISFENPYPAEQVYLVAAKWTEYSRKNGNILVQAELRKPDSLLANKYINATIGYLSLYQKLIGPYPYPKFTLVENFWETGYGMPSFTLLGEQVIRLPFIINSSYPHELLHNYWGNGVYTDDEKGNWCEGLTVYLADHLLKEQQGQGAEYRRNTLLKFTDYVNEKNDFPVTKFRSRNNSAEEAIGYGKVMMIFEMLRYDLGDEIFMKAVRNFYAGYKFRIASYDDIRKEFEKASGKDLKTFFDQWTTRKGAPELKLSNVSVIPGNNTFELKYTISQVQKEDLFVLKVPVVIYLENNDNVIVRDVIIDKRSQTFSLSFPQRPLKIDVDPQFNVFRRLDIEEEPLTISRIYGNKDVLMILPHDSPFLKEYSDLAEQWKESQSAQKNNFDIRFDSDIPELPQKDTWIVGFDNKFAKNLNAFDKYSVYLPEETNKQVASLKKTGALVYVFPNPENKSFTNAFLGSNNQKAISSLKKKIMHYTSYSYLGFDGDDAVNKLKGEFPVINSPLSHIIQYDGIIPGQTGKLKPRQALVY